MGVLNMRITNHLRIMASPLLLVIIALAACGSAASTPSPSTPPPASKPGSQTSATASPAASPSAKPAASAPAAVSPSASASAASDLPEFTWAVAGANGVLVAAMAKDQGFDKKYGINLNIVTAGNGTRALQMLQAGQAQVVQSGLSSIIVGNAGGATFRVIDSDSNRLQFIIIGGKDMTPANAAQAMKGKKVGITTFGSESDVAATLFIEHLDLARDKDVSVIQTGDATAQVAALQNGAIDATPLNAGAAVTAQRSGFQPLWDLFEGSDWLFQSNAADQKYLAANRDQMLRFEKMWGEGAYYTRTHADQAKKVIANAFKTEDTGVIDAVYTRWTKASPIDLRPSTAGIKAELDHFIGVKDLNLKSTNPSDYVDQSLLDELDKINFLSDLRKQYGIAA
jgi:ABC-type nitrate/sulfonate/bicarbonate transport system substrate-binding protein